MKTILLNLLAIPSLMFLAACESPDDGMARDAGVGAATGAAIGGVIGHQSDSTAEGAAIGAAAGAGYNRTRDRDDDDRRDRDFDSLDDYDDELNSEERAQLRDRAIEAGDDPDDYLDYLTTEGCDKHWRTQSTSARAPVE